MKFNDITTNSAVKININMRCIEISLVEFIKSMRKGLTLT